MLKWLRKEISAAYTIHEDVGPRDFLWSAALWTAGIAWALPTLSTLTVLGNWFKIQPEQMHAFFKLYSHVQLKLLGVRWQAQVHPEIDPQTPYVFMKNHVNHFDFITCHNASPHFRQGLELDLHFKYPLYGPLMRSRGTIAVKAGVKGQTADLLEKIRAEIDRGRSILAFPEGTRTRDGRVAPFKSGMFFIARDLGVPIVPIAVTGMWEVMRKGSILLRPGKDVNVYMGRPIATAGLDDRELQEVVVQARDYISDKVDRYYEEQ